MPVYNRADYIMETIESVRSQTWQNWELLIIDDGSDDPTAEVVAGVKDERISFYKAGRIGINGRIKNIGLEKARGELIAFIDSDDLWSPGKIEKQVLALQQFPEAGFSLTGGYNFRKKQVVSTNKFTGNEIAGNELVEFFYKQSSGIRYANAFLSFFKSEVAAFTQALLFRKDCLTVTGYFNETKPFADPEFILELARNFKLVILYEPLLYRRLHNDNHSSSNWITAYEQSIQLIESYYHKKMLPLSVARHALFRLHINFGEDCLMNNEKKRAMDSFLKAWRKNPLNIVAYRKMGKVMLYSLGLRKT